MKFVLLITLALFAINSVTFAAPLNSCDNFKKVVKGKTLKMSSVMKSDDGYSYVPDPEEEWRFSKDFKSLKIKVIETGETSVNEGLEWSENHEGCHVRIGSSAQITVLKIGILYETATVTFDKSYGWYMFLDGTDTN